MSPPRKLRFGVVRNISPLKSKGKWTGHCVEAQWKFVETAVSKTTSKRIDGVVGEMCKCRWCHQALLFVTWEKCKAMSMQVLLIIELLFRILLDLNERNHESTKRHQEVPWLSSYYCTNNEMAMHIGRRFGRGWMDGGLGCMMAAWTVEPL